MSKRLILFSVTIIFCVILSSCVSTPKAGDISEVFTSKSIGEDKRPVEISNTFSPDSDIYFTFKSNVSGAKFFYKVIKPEEDLDSRTDYSKGEVVPILKEYNGLKIKSGGSAWGSGDYTILFYLDDKEEGSISFTID